MGRRSGNEVAEATMNWAEVMRTLRERWMVEDEVRERSSPWASLFPDGEERIRDAALWCLTRRPIRDLWGAALDPGLLVEHALPSTAADTEYKIEELCRFRRGLLGALGVSWSPGSSPSGRVLWYLSDENLFDGAAEQASQGFFNVQNLPPWDTWLGFRQMTGGPRGASGTLFAWVPDWCLALADAGIHANPEECIGWV